MKYLQAGITHLKCSIIYYKTYKFSALKFNITKILSIAKKSTVTSLLVNLPANSMKWQKCSTFCDLSLRNNENAK